MFYESQRQTITVTRKHDRNGNPVYTAKASGGISTRYKGNGGRIEEEYQAAARQLCTELQWPGDWAYGESLVNGGHSRVFVSLDGVNGK